MKFKKLFIVLLLSLLFCGNAHAQAMFRPCDKEGDCLDINSDGTITATGGSSSGEITGAFTQLTSCPADIVAYVAALAEDTRVQFPTGCSYTLTTASTVEIPSGVWIDFADTLFNRTATAAGIITATTKDVTKSIHISNVRCTGAFATSCISIDQNAGTVGGENAFVLRNIQFDFTPDASLTSVFGFVIQDTGHVIDGVRGKILTSASTTSAFGIRAYMNSTAEADIYSSVNDWNVRVDCQSYTPTFCRGLDVSYQNASAGGSLFNRYGKVSNFYSYAHSGGATGTGEACKQTNDSGRDTVNEAWWSNGVCDGVTADFRDGSAFGDPVIAHIDNVEFTNGKYTLKSTGTYTLKGSSGKTSNFWTVSSSSTASIDSQGYLATFLAYIVAENDRVYLPPSMQFNASLSITKSLHLIGGGTDGCTHVATYGGANTQLFNITADNVSLENLCLDIAQDWDGILVNGTGGTSLTSVNLKNIKISKTAASGSTTGIIYNDAAGIIDSPKINLVCTTGTCNGISFTDASTVDAVATSNIYNPNIILTATSGSTTAISSTDSSSPYAHTKNIYSGYYSSTRSTGTSYGVSSSGANSFVYNYGLRGSASDIDVLQLNGGTASTNATPMLSPFTIAGSGPSASGSTSFAGGINVPSGQQIDSNGERVNYPLSVYASGTVYTLTATSALVDFGTTDPILTVDKPGTYWVSAKAQLKYNGASYATSQTANCKIRRTNNTAADLSNATRSVDLRNPATTIVDAVGVVDIPEIIYTTSNYDDHVQLWCSVSALPTAGTVEVVSAEIIAKRQF